MKWRVGVTWLEIAAGYEMPRGWGVAWVRHERATSVILPVPLNVIAGALYRLWWWLRAPFDAPRILALEAEIKWRREHQIEAARNAARWRATVRAVARRFPELADELRGMEDR